MDSLLSGILVASAVLCVAPAARAQYEAGVFGGAHLYHDRNRLGRYDRDPVSTGYTSSGMFGGRFAYLPSRFVGGEVQLSVVPTTTRDDRASATLIYVRGHVIGTIPLGKVRPFVLLGAGSATVIPNDPFYLRRDTDLNVHGGAGVRYDIDKLWGVRVEAQSNAVPRTDRNGFGFEGTFLLGVYGNFPWPPTPELPFDKDHDFITDDKDECPDEAGEVRFGGCPDPDAEEDKDKAGEEAPAPEAPANGAAPAPTPPGAAPPDGAPAPAPAPSVKP